MMHEIGLLEFKSYRFPDRIFLLTEQDLKRFRELEGEIIKKEEELFEFIKNRTLGGE